MRAVILPALLICPAATAAEPGGGWPSPLPITVVRADAPPPPPPVDDGVPVRVIEVMELPEPGGQQHWFALNAALGQPSVGRVGVKILDRANNSLWLEAYGGGALYDTLFGFGARLQHTAWTLGHGDSFFISPGLGVQFFPDWYAADGWTVRGPHGRRYRTGSYNTLTYLAADVDFSWLHDFSPRFGFELGLKLGLAGHIGGTVGWDYPSELMWGKSVFPIVALYCGFRF